LPWYLLLLLLIITHSTISVHPHQHPNLVIIVIMTLTFVIVTQSHKIQNKEQSIFWEVQNSDDRMINLAMMTLPAL